MLYLIDLSTRKVVEKHPGDFDSFIEKEWGGWFPFVRDGVLQTTTKSIHGCRDYSKAWSATPKIVTGITFLDRG